VADHKDPSGIIAWQHYTGSLHTCPNNEVAYMILRGMELEIDVCLTGLRVAAHLNGREGIIRGPDPTDNERCRVQL